MPQIKALFFDLDGTLLQDDGRQPSIAHACKVLEDRQIGVPADQLIASNLKAASTYWRTVEQDVMVGLIEGRTFSLEAWRLTFLGCGIVNDELVTVAEDAFSEHALQSYRLFRDAEAVLEQLAGKLPLGLITNGPSDTQRPKIEVAGIGRYFDAVLVSGEVGAAKPDAAIFHQATRQLGVEPSESLHVGDSLHSDVAGALNAGLGAAVWLNRHGASRDASHPTPHHEIASLAELPGLLTEA